MSKASYFWWSLVIAIVLTTELAAESPDFDPGIRLDYELVANNP